MNSLFSFQPPASITTFYQSLTASKPKEKVDMILEPFQAMVQLALLSICPIGTKLCIHENILYLQSPTLIQPFTRWYHSDKKDDVYFLYGVMKRYIKWYNPQVNKESPVSQKLYQLVTSMAIEGLDCLFKTYRSADSNTVIHVIQMYKNILELNNDKIMTEDYSLDVDKSRIHIDEVFEKIVAVYEPMILEVVYHTLELIQAEKDSINQTHMIDGLNLILHKTTKAIREWIRVHLTL
jgi:hypothetical protein